MDKHLFITGGLYLFYLISTYCSYAFQNKGTKEIVFLVLYPLFELILLFFYSKYCSSVQNRFFKVFFIIINSVLYFIIICQFIYFFLSGEYITLLALENVNQAYVVMNWIHIVVLVLIILSISKFAKLIYDEHYFLNIKSIAVPLVLCSFVVLIQNGVFVNSHKYSKYVFGTPLGSFFETTYYYFSNNTYVANNIRTNINSYVNKENIFESVLPFQSSEDFIDKPNIIILFTEGTSSRLLGCYGGKYNLLTPNIDDFSNHSMKVVNYFNHTAATFRGTHGQLASCYPFKGGYGNGQWADKNYKEEYMKRSYQTLPNILNNLGYDTYFLSPHKNEDPYTNLLKMLKFKKVYVAEDYNKSFSVSGEMYHDSVRDIDMYKSLKSLMEGMSNSSPFLICMYTLNTHAFMDTYEEGLKYKIKNSVLNTLHNLDYCFGNFWNWFKQSKYSKDTIIIFTADHAHYYEKPYVELMSVEKDYKKFFIDKIPLIIYDPIHNLPKEYDGCGKTSLDLTPSILHLLNVNYIKNSFLGSSIFDERSKKELNFAALGNDFYYIMDNEVYRYNELRKNGHLRKIIDNKVDLIKDYYALEEINDVFKE